MVGKALLMTLRILKIAAVLCLAALAWLRFSDNTADNDLWGHVLFGYRTLALGGPEQTDPFSWTAGGGSWINHEWLSEAAFALVHRAAGGTGLWCLMIAMAAATLALTLQRQTGRWWAAAALLAPSVNLIALGFAVRPQIFSALFLVLLLRILLRSGHHPWQSCAGIAVLFAAWANFHGGYLAGFLVLAAAAAGAALDGGDREEAQGLGEECAGPRTAILALFLATAVAASLANPWGAGLIRWTVQSVMLPRETIPEWAPPGLSGQGTLFLLTLAISAGAWLFSSRPRRGWQAAILVVLAAMGLRSARHIPWFALANLLFTPGHLQSALQKVAPHAEGLRGLFRRRSLQAGSALVLAAIAAFLFQRSFAPPKRHPFRIEAERGAFPAGAVDFVRSHSLAGPTIDDFDWGEYFLWELPDNPVSFDGRLDTVYPRSVIDAHWRFYAGGIPGRGLTRCAPRLRSCRAFRRDRPGSAAAAGRPCTGTASRKS